MQVRAQHVDARIRPSETCNLAAPVDDPAASSIGVTGAVPGAWLGRVTPPVARMGDSPGLVRMDW
jgi:hypothetical protein